MSTLMLAITFKPLGRWPKNPTTNRRRSPFKYRWNEVLGALERELRHLGASSCEIHIDLNDGWIRRDGWPRADARPGSPKIIISFTAKNLPGSPTQVYPCDTYSYWQDNVKAIAVSLEKLRAVDRYGVTTAGEQYAGFKALPSSTGPTMTTEAAAIVLGNVSHDPPSAIIVSVELAKAAARTAKHRSHPDRNDGDSSMWGNVQTAIAVLSSHHGVSL